MPLCVYCNKPLQCGCRKDPQPIGQSTIACPNRAPGKMWIHVMDDIGGNVKGVAVKGPSSKETVETGLAVFDPVGNGDYTAELLVPLEKKIGDKYDAPEEAGERKRGVTVTEGTLAYVLFTLTRKSTLRARFKYVDDPKKSLDPVAFTAATVKVKAEREGKPSEVATSTGVIAELLPAGTYDVTPDYAAVDAAEFDYKEETNLGVDLPAGGESEELVFTLARKAKLKIEVIYKRDEKKAEPKEFLKDEVVTFVAEFAGNDYHSAGKVEKPTAQGVADFGGVSAGKYTITPDYSKVTKCKIDYVEAPFEIELMPGEVRVVEVEVEPLYQTVQLLAHCLLTIPNRVYVKHASENLIPTNTTNPEEPTFEIEGVEDESMFQGEWKGTYHGYEDERTDIEKRIEFLKYVLNEAYGKADADRTNLKVFMVPECYFQGLYGAYLFENVGYLFDQMMTLASEEKWKDWLFALGTVNCVDTGISVVDPEKGTLGGTGITQMMNYSPVVRGGVAKGGKGGGGETDPQFRLIQKLVNSAELLDDVELIPHPGYDPTAGRKIAVNQDVQFQGTENEDKVARALSMIIDSTHKEYDAGAKAVAGTPIGMPDEQWDQLVTAINEDVAELGIVRVVRSIRLCNIGGKTEELDKWAYCGFEERTKGHLNTNKTRFSDATGVLMTLLAEAWSNDYQVNDPGLRVPVFDQQGWRKVVGTAKMGRILAAAEGAFDTVGARLDYQKTAIGMLLGTLKGQHEQVADFFQNARLLKMMREVWDQDYVTNPPVKPKFGKAQPPLAFSLENWTTLMEQPDKTRINRIHDTVRAGMDAEALQQGCSKSVLEQELEELFTNRNGAISFMDRVGERPPETFGLTIYPVWKKILELYCREKPVADIVLTQSVKDMNFRDFCFAGVRKAGPLIPWDEAEVLDPCRKLVFGLEICADHAGARLKNALAGPAGGTKPAIDIQLVPSAGMTLAQGSIVARDGGWAFNCDGWNGKDADYKAKEGTFLKVWFDAPKCEFKNPVTPHSAVGKGGASLSRASYPGVATKLDDGKAAVLFAKGAGALHVYTKQPLPK